MKTKISIAVVLLAGFAATFGPWPDHEGRSTDHPPAAVDANTGLTGRQAALVAEAEASAPAASRPLVAAPRKPREGPECRRTERYHVTADGSTLRLLSCEPGNEAATGYGAYSNAALESLVYGDAGAAATLAMRLREADPARAMQLVFRASALSGGDVQPLLAFSNAYPQATAVDGRPVRTTVHARYLLSAVADLLGADVSGLAHWESVVQRHSRDPETELQRLREQAQAIFIEMQRIERDVTGNSTLGGQADA